MSKSKAKLETHLFFDNAKIEVVQTINEVEFESVYLSFEEIYKNTMKLKPADARALETAKLVKRLKKFISKIEK